MMFIQTVNRTDRLYPLAYAVKSKFLVHDGSKHDK